MNIDGHYDEAADIAWLRFAGFDPGAVVSEETDFGLRDLVAGRVVGLEFWRASERLPAALLAELPSPPVEVAR
ncbi:MAG: hypothetical protein QOE65_2139 [Solirubrobacteraceae bacterium]|jgi:uncharacterized protein YuzE|nr:hypothetical protein [Solirubrobacteraceae bacterium]